MRRLLVILIIAFFMVFIGGCALSPRISATVTITDWNQDYNESSGEWGLVNIYYDVQNTGNKKIDYYVVTFKVYCKRATSGVENVYTDWDNGPDNTAYIPVGKKVSDWTLIDTEGNEADSVIIENWELESY